MTDMLTAKEMQGLLQVDRSTIYRMAEAGQLPAIRVGKQWRFPSDQVDKWLQNRNAKSVPILSPEASRLKAPLAALLPLDCVQLIQDAFAETLGVMLVITDLEGQPITQASNTSPIYNLLGETPKGHRLCQEQWHDLAQIPALEPRFVPGWGGILCARALVRLNNELKGMVISFGIAPQNWPPSPTIIVELAQSLQITPDELQSVFAEVASLTLAEQRQVLLTIQRIADILAHIINERYSFMDRLETIAKLSSF
jgi:excisionase family DNA binding protein